MTECHKICKTGYTRIMKQLRKENTTAILFLSKFHPNTAPLYLAFLFMKYNIQPKSSEWDVWEIRSSILLNRNPFVPKGIDGAEENRGPFSDHENESFQKIFNLVQRNKCKLYDLGTKYYSERGKKYIIVMCFL